MKQLLLDSSFRVPAGFGGENQIGVRKSRRPFSKKQSMHVVFRSSCCNGPTSFLMPERAKFVRGLLKRLVTSYGVRLYRQSINSNHIHLILRAPSRRNYVSFCRAFSGMVAFRFMETKKGCPSQKYFWDNRPFSRIVAWGKAFLIACAYVEQNVNEAAGLISYRARGNNVKRRSLTTRITGPPDSFV